MSLLGGIDITAAPYKVDRTGKKIDGGSIQQALLDAATKGDPIAIPAGNYRKNYQLLAPATTHIIGVNRNGVTITDTTDLPGKSSIVFQEDPASVNYPFMTDITFHGPGTNKFNAGSIPARMLGPTIQSDATLQRVTTTGYYAGFGILGNHNGLEHCKAYGNYYGAYWLPGNSFGNQTLRTCELVLNNMASIAIHGDSYIDSSVLDQIHLGWAPYGILKENTGNYGKHIVFNSPQFGVFFETIGNGAIHDQGMKKAFINNNVRTLECIWNPAYRLQSEPADYTFGMDLWQGNPTSYSSIGVGAGAKGVFDPRTNVIA